MTQKVPGVDPLREAFQSLADGASVSASCPPASRFWEAQRGEAPSEEARDLMNHVASCPSCAQAWRLARELYDAEAIDPAVPDRWWLHAGLIAALAAMLLLALASGYLFRAALDGRVPASMSGTNEGTAGVDTKLQAAEARIAALERQIAGLSSAAHINVPFIELQPERLRSSSPAPITAEIPPGATMAVLVLATDGVTPREPHRLELVDENDRVKWSATGLRTGADGAFTAVVPTSQLPAGAYRLVASVDRAAGKVTVQEYRVRIVYRQS